MRTTATIDDDILQTARQIAARCGVSLGRVLSDLARRGLQQELIREERGFPVLDIPSTAFTIRSEAVRKALDEDDRSS